MFLRVSGEEAMKNSTVPIRRLHATKNVLILYSSSTIRFVLRSFSIMSCLFPSFGFIYLQENGTVVPPWLIVMYNTVFFGNCMVHPNTKKNELDRFCIDCVSSLCSHCLPVHIHHKHVKV